MSVTSSEVVHPSYGGIVTHIVLIRVRKDAPACTIERVFGVVHALQAKVAGVLSYAWGPYSSPEGLGRGYTHGFCITFTHAEARDMYLQHPDHENAKKSVCSIAEGGIEGLLAFDLAS